MNIVIPEPITDAVVTANDLVNIESDWVAGTYSLGDRAVYGRKVYEVVADPDTADRPDLGAVADPPTWVELGYSNRWRMFTEGTDSVSTAEGEINATLEFNKIINTVAVLGVQGASVTLTMTDPIEGLVYDQTIELIDIGVGDWWEYFFLPYDSNDAVVFHPPPYMEGVIDVTVTATGIDDPVEAGRIVAGISRELGVTLYGSSVDLQEYSIKDRDGFGNLTLVQRRTIKSVNYDVLVDTVKADLVIKQLSRLSGVPALYIGDPAITSTVTFGVFSDVSQGINDINTSELTLRVEEF